MHFSLISDYQMIANEDISYGSTATTNGKIYAGRDSSGVNHSVNHDGTASKNIYAEGSNTGVDHAHGDTGRPEVLRAYRGRSAGIAQPINFANFQLALDDIKAAAGVSGTATTRQPGTPPTSYKLVFSGNGAAAGTYTIARCTPSNPASSSTAPTCGSCVGGDRDSRQRRDLRRGDRDHLRPDRRARHRGLEQRHRDRRQHHLRGER